MDVVTAGLLEIYQSLLHLTFHLVEGAPVWHPDVTLYEAREADDESQIAGYFYLDLYPREGKYNHAAVFKLQGYYQFPDGSLQYPVCAMVANFPEVRITNLEWSKKTARYISGILLQIACL